MVWLNLNCSFFYFKKGFSIKSVTTLSKTEIHEEPIPEIILVSLPQISNLLSPKFPVDRFLSRENLLEETKTRDTKGSESLRDILVQ